MNGPAAALDRWLLHPAPATRLAAVRIVTGLYAVGFLLVRLPGLLQVVDLPPHRFHPVGPLAWMPGPVSPGAGRAVLALTVVVGVAFVLGWRWRVSGPAFAVAFLAVATYRASWGHVLHTDHLVALHLLVLGLVPAADAWSLDARAAGGAPAAGPPPPLRPPPTAAGTATRYGWPLQIMALLTVITYVLAGWAKLRNGGTDWLVGDVLRNQIAFDNLRKVLLGDLHSPVGGWVVRHGWLFPPLAVLTVAVELGAPLALRGGRWRTTWVAAAWSFHVGIVVLMAISFPYELLGVAYAAMFPMERVVGPVLARLARWSRRRGDRPHQPVVS